MRIIWSKMPEQTLPVSVPRRKTDQKLHGCIMIQFLLRTGCFTAPLAFHGTELEIHLDTGRHHQIRVQLASVGCPIVGDTKYNQELSDTTGWQTIRLCAYKLDFKHPITHKTMHFQLANDPV